MRNPFTVFRRCRELEEENAVLRSQLSEMRRKEYISAFVENAGLPKINNVCRSCAYAATSVDSRGFPFFVGCQKDAMCSNYKPVTVVTTREALQGRSLW